MAEYKTSSVQVCCVVHHPYFFSLCNYTLMACYPKCTCLDSMTVQPPCATVRGFAFVDFVFPLPILDHHFHSLTYTSSTFSLIVPFPHAAHCHGWAVECFVPHRDPPTLLSVGATMFSHFNSFDKPCPTLIVYRKFASSTAIWWPTPLPLVFMHSVSPLLCSKVLTRGSQILLILWVLFGAMACSSVAWLSCWLVCGSSRSKTPLVQLLSVLMELSGWALPCGVSSFPLTSSNLIIQPSQWCCPYGESLPSS